MLMKILHVGANWKKQKTYKYRHFLNNLLKSLRFQLDFDWTCL